MITGILDDLVVLDLSEGVAGPLCARLLADYGAKVVKIEPPGGGSSRSLPDGVHVHVVLIVVDGGWRDRRGLHLE